MARTNILDKVRRLNSMDIAAMDRESLIDLVSKGSKLHNQNIRRLEKHDVYKEVLGWQKESQKVTEIKRAKAEKMTNTQLRKELTRLKQKASNRTSSIERAKETVARFRVRTGVLPSQLTPEDWEAIRRRIEENPAASDEIIEEYWEEKNGDDEEDNYPEDRLLTFEEFVYRMTGRTAYDVGMSDPRLFNELRRAYEDYLRRNSFDNSPFLL